MFTNQHILICGGSGSWGVELVTQLLKKEPKKITIFSRNEVLQVKMQRKFNNSKLKFILGDIRDYSAILNASKGVDYLINLSAYKHVPLGEEQPDEFIKTNIAGLQNVIRAAIENKIKKVIYSSTDKACLPINLYGMTKAIGEKLVIHADNTNRDTRFINIRAGNAAGSNG